MDIFCGEPDWATCDKASRRFTRTIVRTSPTWSSSLNDCLSNLKQFMELSREVRLKTLIYFLCIQHAAQERSLARTCLVYCDSKSRTLISETIALVPSIGWWCIRSAAHSLAKQLVCKVIETFLCEWVGTRNWLGWPFRTTANLPLLVLLSSFTILWAC